MTRIIFGGIDKNTFNLLEFYIDRCRRIIPALFVLCFAVLLWGWFFILPSEFLFVGKHAAAAILFVSNIIFWRESGYFDVNSHGKWLLHTWSLSVEWQFYVLYPIALLVLRRLMRARFAAIAVLVGLFLSYGLCAYVSTRSPSTAFFLLPTRAWEMMAGGAVYLFPIPWLRRHGRIVEAFGLLLILAAALGFVPMQDWPGWQAGIPVAGAALLLWADRADSPFTANPVSYWLGRISYSVYLWHWPVAVALYHLGRLADPAWQIGGILLSFVLGAASFVLVEQPASRHLWKRTAAGGLWSRRYQIVQIAALPLAIGLAAGLVWKSHGLPGRFAPAVVIADAEASNGSRNDGCIAEAGPPVASCSIGNKGGLPAVELIGDSHALSAASALAAAVPESSPGGLKFEAYASCPTIQSVSSDSPESDCAAFNRKYLLPMLEGAGSDTPVVIVNYWLGTIKNGRYHFTEADGAVHPFSEEAYRREFLATVCRLATRRPTYVTLPIPTFDEAVPQTMVRALLADPKAPDLVQDIATYRAANLFETDMVRASADCGVHVLDPTPYLCPNGRCLGSLDQRPLYLDRHHLSEHGNRLLVPMFAQIFEPATGSVAATAH